MVRRFYNLPSLTALAAFEASARHLSFKDAARELNVTPGAVSRQIKALEQEAGTMLFRRVHRGVLLTDAGEELFHVLARGFGQAAEVFGRIKVQSTGPTVTVGATTAFASLWLMPRIGTFWRAHPEITVNHQISDAAEDLRHPGIDLRIRYGSGQWTGEATQQLFEDVIYPVAGPGFAKEHRKVEAEQLGALPLIDLQGVDADWIDWRQWFAMAGLPRPTGRTSKFNNYIIALQAARDDQGIAMGWHSQVKPLIDAGELVRLADTEIRAPGAFFVTWQAERVLSPAACTLRDWLSDEALDK